MKKILSMLLVLCMALTLCSAAFAEGKSPVDGMTVAFIPKVSGNSFFEAANDGAQKYAKEWGLTVDYIGAPTADVTTQLELIQQAIDKGVDAICISSVDATGLDEKLQEAQDAGIYVSTWDSDVSPNARALMVSQGTADVLGPMLVEMAVDSLKERGVDVNGEVKYVWHFSNPSVSDQNSWSLATLTSRKSIRLGLRCMIRTTPTRIRLSPSALASPSSTRMLTSMRSSATTPPLCRASARLRRTRV